MAVKEIQRFVSEWYNSNVKPQIDSARSYDYFREIVLGIIAVCLVGGGFWGYRYYKAQKESSAQVAFASVLQIYHEAIQGKTDVWPSVEMQSTLLHDKYKGSSIAPYLLIIKADALVGQGRLTEALNVLDSVIEHLPKDFPVLSI